MRLILSGGITFNRFCPPPLPPPEPRQDPLAGGRGLQYSPQIPDPKPFTAPPTHLKISGSAICHTSHFKCLDVVTYGLLLRTVITRTSLFNWKVQHSPKGTNAQLNSISSDTQPPDRFSYKFSFT